MKKTAKIIIVSVVCLAMIVPIFLAFGCGEKYEFDQWSLDAAKVFMSNGSIKNIDDSGNVESLAADIFEIKTKYESMGGVTVNLTEETYRDFYSYLLYELDSIRHNTDTPDPLNDGKMMTVKKYQIDNEKFEKSFKQAFEIK